MPIISTIERKTVRGRLLLASIFVLLTLGGMTMVYPFALMLSGALRSEMDQADLDFVPEFLRSETSLYQKFLETKYNQDTAALNRAHGMEYFSFREVVPPARANPRATADLRSFLEQAPEHWQILGGTHGVRTVPENLRAIRRILAVEYGNDREALGREIGVPLEGWNSILFPPPRWASQRYEHGQDPVSSAYHRVFKSNDLAERKPVFLSGHFLQIQVFPVFGRNALGEINRGLGLNIDHLGDFRLPVQLPPEANDGFTRAWTGFIHDNLNPSFVLLPDSAAAGFRDHLREKYESIESLNKIWNRAYRDFDDISLPGGEWLGGGRRIDYLDFLKTRPPHEYRLTGPEYAWPSWLENRYGSIDSLNRAHGREWASFDEVGIPIAELEWEHAMDQKLSLRFRYASRNFINVFDELFVQGRIFFNTVILCALAVVSALLINPLAAYAMSRFRLPGTYKILLFLMATMAFPPIITLIPTFIILRNLDLLNTFAALVLPTVANGYLIFLLKGFFDSLPGELYEAATLDGASEMRIFFQITMALSKPILAVVALQAFNSAYLMFLYALVVAPDPDMWILNVWLYQWQKTASMGSVMASVLIASIPTLIIFLFAQNIIMRGIVVPVEK